MRITDLVPSFAKHRDHELLSVSVQEYPKIRRDAKGQICECDPEVDIVVSFAVEENLFRIPYGAICVVLEISC